MELARLFVTIAGQDAPLMATLAGVRRTLTGFASGAGSLHVPLGGLVAGLLGAGAATTMLAKEAANLEKAYSQIRKTTGLAGADMDSLKKKLEGLATTMAGVTLDDVLSIAASAGRLGIEGADGIAAFTKSIAMMHIAMDGIPVDELTTRVSRVLNVFKLGPEAALAFGSALNRLDDTSTATGREILDVAQRLSGAASALGLSPQKVLALAATLKDAGIETEVAGSSFSQILMKMATDTEKFAKVAGVSVQEFAGTMKGDPLKAIKLLVAGMAGMESGERMKALDQLGLDGVRTGGSLLQLSQVIGKLDGNVAVANSEWQSHASILREVEIAGQTTYAQLDLLWNNIKLTAGSLGSLLLPALKDAAAAMGEVASTIRDHFGEIQAYVAPAMEMIRSGIESAMFVFRNFGNIVALVGVDIAEALDIVVSRTTWAADAIQAALEWAVQSVVALGSSIASGLATAMSSVVDVLGAALGSAVDLVASNAKWIGEAVLNMATEITRAINNPFRILFIELTNLEPAIRRFLGETLITAENFGAAIGDMLGSVFAGIPTLLTDFSGMFASLMTWIIDTAVTVGEAIYEAFAHPFSSLGTLLSNFATVMQKTLAGVVPTAKDLASLIPQAFERAISRIPSLKLKGFKFDSGAWNEERDKIRDRIAANEIARLNPLIKEDDVKAQKAAEAAKGGEGKAPSKDGKFFSGGLEEFAKKLQEGAFKDDSGKKTAENTMQTSKNVQNVIDVLKKLKPAAGWAT